jgi:DNA repair ATPase RecN
LDEKLSPRSEPPVAVELRNLVSQAQGGDPAALSRIRQILDDCPELWHHAGDLASFVERNWISILAAENPVAVESMKRTIAAMKEELSGEHPTRLEGMLVNQVLANWLEVQYVESISADSGRSSLDQAAFRLKRLESAQRRYAESIKTLATIRQQMPKGLAPTNAMRIFDPAAKMA